MFVGNRRDTKVKTVGQRRLPVDFLKGEKGKSHVRGHLGRVQIERVVFGEDKNAVRHRVKGDEHGRTCQLEWSNGKRHTEESEITA